MKKFKIKKKNKFLYQGYKESKMLSEQGLSIKNNEQYNTKGIPQDKRVNRLKKIRRSKVTQIIAVACLDNECGCTYISQALANYIKARVNSKILMVDKAGKNDIPNNQGVAFQVIDFINLNNNYKYVVTDMGNLKKKSDSEKLEYKRANIKIMISNLEDDYLRQLAAYIKEDKKFSMKCAYIFNLVPQDKKRKVHKLMEAYEHYCLSIIDKDNLSYDAMKVFNNILSRKRG